MMEDGIMKKSLFIATALLALAACTREMDVDTPAGNVTITAKTETSAETKTVVEGETHVYWEPGDEIKVFAGGNSGKFTTDITASAATAEFKGTLGVANGADIWAVYPYSQDATFSDGAITTVLPAQQVARAGSFGKDMNLAIAHSTTSDLQFYNVCGGACFSVTNKGIKKVSFKSINGESLAGKVQVAFEEGAPVIKRIIDGTDEITVNAPDGEFVPGESYFAVMLPQELAAGIVVSYNDALCSAGLTVEIASITRSYYGRLDQSDHWFAFDGDYATPGLVDLGLSVMWGTFNLGATAPSEYGHYYAWGESVPKTFYDWGTYRWGLGVEYDDIFKYCTIPLLGLNEFTDDLVTLEPEDDAAHLILGDKWRMPTKEEWNELMEGCTRSIVRVDDVIGCKFTSKINGESIFLPAAGGMSNASSNYVGSWGYYWTSSLFVETPNLAYLHSFDTVVLNNWRIDDAGRCRGYSIRPVYGDPKPVIPDNPVPDPVDLGLPSGLKWASFNLGASKPEEYGDYFAWGETEPKDVYSWSTYKWCIDGNNHAITKYCIDSQYGNNEFTDGVTILNPEDDAAYANLGGEWRMPTDWEWAELFNNCSSTWTTENGVYGCLFTSKDTGNSIFLPAAGSMLNTTVYSEGSYCFYWSSSLDTHSSDSALAMYFGSNEQGTDDASRYGGTPIRPVYGDLVIIPVESVSLDKTELELFVGDSSDLIATILPDNASIKSVIWSSSDETVASVSSTGVVMGIAAGSAVISITTNNGGKTATCNVTVKESPSLPISVPEAIDLGLPSGLKWASFNLGATKPEEYGDYYAWGEVYPKYDYSFSAYKWFIDGNSHAMTKYCTNSSYGYNGFTDGKIVLDPEDDAAHVNLGGNWRMPTETEWGELEENCTWTWTSDYNGSGVAGRIATSKIEGYTSNSIFLPAAGYRFDTSLFDAGVCGVYWSSSLNTDWPNLVGVVDFFSDTDTVNRGGNDRCLGLSVRPVTE